MVSYTLLAGGYTSFITSLLFSPDASPPSLTVQSTYPAGDSPSWMEISPVNKSIVYATNEVTVGAYLSFLVSDPSTGAIQQIESISSGGNGPAFATPLKKSDGTADQAAILNYNSGNMQFVSLESDLVHFASSDGSPQSITFTPPAGSSGNGSSHPHFALQHDEEVFICDLGSDEIWRLSPSSTSTGQSSTTTAYEITGSIPQPQGSGPRRAAIFNSTIYTLHELDNSLTQQDIPTSTSSSSAPVISSLSIVPQNVTDAGLNGTYAGGELLFPPSSANFTTPFLYASNRNTAASPPPEGDSIAIFSLNPLTLVGQVYTGLNQLRGMALFGEQNEFLVVGGLVGNGGVVVYERTDGGKSLKEIARSTDTNALGRSTFVWV